MRAPHIARAFGAALVVLAAANCTEPNRNAISSALSIPVLQAQLDISDSTARAESEISVTVRLRGTQSAQVGSFTARVAYDSSGLRFVGESAPSDGATRVSNPQPGIVRVAGIAPEGFTQGMLYVARFIVVQPSAIRSLHLFVDEVHSAAGNDVSAALEGRTP